MHKPWLFKSHKLKSLWFLKSVTILLKKRRIKGLLQCASFIREIYSPFKAFKAFKKGLR